MIFQLPAISRSYRTISWEQACAGEGLCIRSIIRHGTPDSIGLQASLECFMRRVMQGDVEDVSEQYLELVREHLHRFREALAVHFPEGAPHLALIELPDVGCVPIPRRQVTDLLEFQRTEEVVVVVDERQLEFEWPSSHGLDPPAMTLRIKNPERKMVSRRRAS